MQVLLRKQKDVKRKVEDMFIEDIGGLCILLLEFCNILDCLILFCFVHVMLLGFSFAYSMTFECSKGVTVTVANDGNDDDNDETFTLQMG